MENTLQSSLILTIENTLSAIGGHPVKRRRRRHPVKAFNPLAEITLKLSLYLGEFSTQK